MVPATSLRSAIDLWKLGLRYSNTVDIRTVLSHGMVRGTRGQEAAGNNHRQYRGKLLHQPINAMDEIFIKYVLTIEDEYVVFS